MVLGMMKGSKMFSQFGDIAPKTLVFGVGLWAIFNWAFIGVELGERSLRANGHIAQCEKRFDADISETAQNEINAIDPPQIDFEREMAAEAAREQLNGPMGDLLRATGQDAAVLAVLRAYEQEKRQAVRAYESAVAAIKERTASKLGGGGDYCGCLASVAVNASRNDFALFSGTLTIFQPSGIQDLDALMLRAQSSNQCSHLV